MYGHLAELDPVPTLARRLREELAAAFDLARPVRLSRAPGRLDVMGGIADYTGSMVCEATLDRAAAVAIQSRADRELQVVSFNLFDEHKPFTFRVPLESLGVHSDELLRREFNEPGRRWAGYLAGCLRLLHEEHFIDLRDPGVMGLNLALHSTVPLGAGVSSSAAIEVATMINLRDHFGLGGCMDALKLAALCQAVENRIVGAPCGIMDQIACTSGEPGMLLRMICQPHELLAPLPLPPGVRVLGINSNVSHSVGGGMYGRTRCAAFMGHRIILEKMREMGRAADKTMIADPMNGYLANLDPEDYKRFFRPYLPESIIGRAFLERYGPTIDPATTIDPDWAYHVQGAVDHHVLEARRVRNFVDFIERAALEKPSTRAAGAMLDRAGHLMYASHLSYTNDALLGSEACDLLVDLVRSHEPAGLYGAKITGGGSGGTVAVLADQSPRADEAIAEILDQYQQRTGHEPEAFVGASPGAWDVGTALAII